MISPDLNYRFQSRNRHILGPGHPDYPVPARKSLFGKHNERGLPIGNLTSQFWGNVYLNELDQFVKRTLKCRYYVRYVDDMVLLAPDRDTLDEWCTAITAFLRDELQLELRPEMTVPFPVRKGIDFVGWKTWWNRRVPRRRTLSSVRTRLDSFERAAVRPACKGMARRIDLRRQDSAGSVECLRSSLASYAGHLRHGAAWRVWTDVWEQHPWLETLFARQGWRLTERWSPRRVTRAGGFQAQYWSAVRHAGNDCLVFFQLGRFIEFYGPQRLSATPVLRLNTALISRAGYAFTVGLPSRLSGVYTARAIRQGRMVVEVRQVPTQLRGDWLRRLPCAVVIPLHKGPDQITSSRMT